ncbi:serine/threonine protein kinase [Rubinisphaera italica]|uniref:non-specific serine/threonine protein kinase n=1 Tax=Rubinisphaera italica TaxID=2527969 RepID=A0A5C5XCC9_9PLAN|nr:serine/threonine-protein kinase [Rubinisphaera italica]TWT60101.1 Serine/threonine-protein kinase PrkC [Rubinisphaera italica]
MSKSSLWVWPFELIEKIGEGGMGVVYRARYVKDDRMFAVKLIPEEITNPTLLARFEREIQVLKKLRHPNIVRAFGGVCEDKQRFYAMELVEGGTLWDKIQKAGYLDWQKITDYGQQMCAALAYAHNQKIVHRDIKPNNFLITKAGQIKLSDFGLVSVMSEAKLTADGRTMGTVQYMSPEQIRGKPPLTQASDLYSLGCVFYEMLTGQPPFTGESPGQILHAHLTEPVQPISKVNRECPASLERLVLQLLEKDIQHRPGSAMEVAEELSRIRISPQLVDTKLSSGSGTKVAAKLDNFEASKELKSTYRIFEQSLKVFWIALCASIILLAAVWAVSLFQSDPGTDLWIEALQSAPNEDVQIAAAHSLARLSEGDSSLLDYLIETAENENATPASRAASLEALSTQPKQTNQYRSRINKLAKSDPNQNIRLAAIECLKVLE